MIIMLQEMTSESVDAILSHPWVRQNFIISEKNPSEQMYFTFLLVDRQLVTADWFRSAYSGSRYGRDALGVDILAAFDGDENAENQRPARRLRFLTTHLESLAETPGFEQRPKQLAVCSRLLKEETVGKYGFEICGGVVGGDMNAISEVDKVTHRREEVGLTDIWEEGIASEGVSGGDGTEIKMGWVEDTFGREEGHTWGYQPRQRWPPIRFDKFFYTGSLETVALEEVRDSSGKVGRLGVGLKTQKGMWVSDHFGIAVGVKML
jgi:tyrosyl-DNA phosphodiesterase 2